MAKKTISTKTLYRRLDKMFNESPVISLKEKNKWVIFSDLHMGDGGSNDDFRRNATLFQASLNDYYEPLGYNLILNGDTEELQRFDVNKIHKSWSLVYRLFDEFHKEGRLYKTIGNHDLQLGLLRNLPFDYNHLESLRLEFEGNHLFVFHGHQASKKYQEHNELIGFTLKYFANPLGIKSYSVSHNSRKQYKIEKRVYGYSAFNRIVSIIGHTHRPLFESLHKVERLRSRIESLCRDLANAKNEDPEEIVASIKAHKKELKKYQREKRKHDFQDYLYSTMFHIPCLFNSGCVVGKRGITCLEIEDDKIRLVHWFDKTISKKYLRDNGYESERIGNTDFYRMVLNEESLNYIFTRINLLAG